ncbi:uncharacterized protein ARMOST_22600 [Armillaria ostoyae]|uniref:Uncharacterized protein n=1 Tax=Armillaria ostoyae TaxID=47428 RepID=A0A284SDC3_ARMOS|nr:uncharacterized protein ARMOST_22600 [Armillaria ostoyae]
MSHEHMVDLSDPPSPHSSHFSHQDFPPLPTCLTPPASTWSKRSWTWGKKGEGPSTVSTKRSQQFLLPDFLRDSKGAQRSPPLNPSSLPPPALNSPPTIPPLDLSSSSLTVKPTTKTTTPPTPQPTQSMPSGSRTTTSPHIPVTDFLESLLESGLHYGHPRSETPPSPHVWSPRLSPSPPPTEELSTNLRRATAAVEDAAVREYSAQAKLNRIVACNETINAYYHWASRSRMEGETAGQYWRQQRTTIAETNAINEVEQEE